MQKLAPPGRKGSVKVGAFKGEKLASEITAAEAKRIAEEEAQQAAVETESHQNQDSETTAQKSLENEQIVAENEKIKAEQLKEQRHAEREAAYAAKEQELQAEREETERRIRKEEKAQKRREAEEEQLRLQAEAEQAATNEQEENERRIRKEQKAQRRREAEEEQLRLQQEVEAAAQLEAEQEAAAKLLRKEQRAQRRLEQEAELLKQQEEELAAEQARQEQIRLAEEAENERIRQEEQNEETEMLKLREAEIARRKALKEQRLREEEEERQREQAAIDEENKALEKERLRAAEEARIAAETTNEEESAELAAKRARAEAQRKKRAMFLNDMDSFSTTFETKTQEAEEQRKETLKKQDEVLMQQMQNKSGQFVAPKAAVRVEEEEVETKPQVVIAEEEPEEVESVPVPSAAENHKHKDSGKNKETLNALSSSLFAANLNDEVVTAPPAESTEPVTAAGSDELRMPSRIGTGTGKSAKKTTTSTTAATSSDAGIPTLRVQEDARMAAMMASMLAATTAATAPVAKGSSKKNSAVSTPVPGRMTSSELENEDDEDEGTGDLTSISNILTKEERRTMTQAQKANWRAKQADLTIRRKDFHGVVTYTFDGIFSWQMYGSAEASDENGNPYTEYLMRCQWGTTFENLQPWIVAHRYKEFDVLDQKLKKAFPSFEKNMPSLPKKDLFRYLDSNVIAQRRTILEDYMSKVVVSMPTILRSEIMNDFLTISERIASIRIKLNLQSSSRTCQASMDDMLSPRMLPPGTDNELFLPVSNKDNSPVPAAPVRGAGGLNSSILDDPFGIGNVSSKKATQKAPATVFHKSAVEEEVDDSNQVLYLTVDSAEEAKERLNSRSLDEDALGHLEEDIKQLGLMLRGSSASAILPLKSKFRTLLLSVANRWPNLRATAVVGMGVDFSLIPRAMQAEEDLMRHISEFRGLETASRS